MTQRLGTGASLLLVVVLGASTGALTYLVHRVTCAVTPDVPFLDVGCDVDAVTLSLIIGGGVTAIGLIGWVVSTVRTRDR